MISDQFRKDYRQLTAQGVEFTPDDIVRLNALMVKVTRSSTASNDVFLPRLAFLPRDSWWRAPLVLREPTLAHWLWLEQAERFLDTSKDEVFLFLYGFALSRHAARLPDVTRPAKLVRTVCRFAAKRLAGFTRDQLASAVEYALYGADWTVGETMTELPNDRIDELTNETPSDHSPIPPSGNSPAPHSPIHQFANSPISPTLGLLADCRMLRLPVTIADAREMTASELAEIRARALEQDGRFDAKANHKRALGAYVRAREEIRKRSKAK